MTSHKYFTFIVVLFSSFSAFGKETKISENELNYSEQKNIAYVDSTQKRPLSPDDPKDVNELAHSTEFEVYKVDEDGEQHTVFEAPSGICYGFNSPKVGVDVTDSNMIYLKKGDPTEYHGNVIGANLDKTGDVKDVQYAPIYVIHNPETAKEILHQNQKNIKKTISRSVEKNSTVLSKTICR